MHAMQCMFLSWRIRNGLMAPASAVPWIAGMASLVALLCAFILPHGALAFTALRDETRGVLTLSPMVESVTPGVVNIAVRTQASTQQNPLLDDPFFRRFFGVPGQPRQRQAASAGSGVIVDAQQGYVLTNHHVVDSAAQIRVTLKDQRSVEAKLVGSDPGTDIALLQISADDLSAVPFGDSDDLKVGDLVVAVGNPFGLGQTVTTGIVSALGRSGLGIEGYEDFIQTDASINPGNSGGALVDSNGRLIGINTAIIGPSGGNVGIGFAVPSNMARAVMDQLIRYGEVRRGRIGISVQSLTPELAEALSIEEGRGAVVTKVDYDSPAATAGLKAGDVIVAANGRGVRNFADLRNQIGLVRAGEKVDLTIVRDGRNKQLTVQVGEAAAEVTPGSVAVPKLAGASFGDIEPGSPMHGNVEGVLVTGIERGSPAARLGLRPGDVITHVNREPVASLKEFENATKNPGRALSLNISRKGEQLFLIIQ